MRLQSIVSRGINALAKSVVHAVHNSRANCRYRSVEPSHPPVLKALMGYRRGKRAKLTSGVSHRNYETQKGGRTLGAIRGAPKPDHNIYDRCRRIYAAGLTACCARALEHSGGAAEHQPLWKPATGDLQDDHFNGRRPLETERVGVDGRYQEWRGSERPYASRNEGMLGAPVQERRYVAGFGNMGLLAGPGKGESAPDSGGLQSKGTPGHDTQITQASSASRR